MIFGNESDFTGGLTVYIYNLKYKHLTSGEIETAALLNHACYRRGVKYSEGGDVLIRKSNPGGLLLMPSKRNQLILAAVLLVAGIVFLINPDIGFGMTSLVPFAAGAAFLLLYHTKRKAWSLFMGVAFMGIGIVNFIGSHLGSYSLLNAVGSMFFIVPAVIFLVLYFDKNRRGLLIPACFMLWFGIFTFLKSFYAFEGSGFALFCGCIGLAFLMLYVIAKRIYGRWTLYGAAAFGAVSVTAFLFTGDSAVAIIDAFPQFAAACVIAAGIIILLRAVRRR